MNKRRFDVAINDLPDHLKISLNQYYENSTSTSAESNLTCNKLSQMIRAWTTKNTLALIFTFGIYGLIYFIKNRKSNTPNLFKAVSASRRAIKELPSIMLTKDTEAKAKHDAVHDNTEDHTSYDDLSAVSAAIKDAKRKSTKNRIEFDKNIRAYHRLLNGNIVVQKFDNTIEVINPQGARVETLSTNHTSEITAFSELKNGHIIAGGKDNDTDNAILIEWGEQTREKVYPNAGKITSLDAIDNIVAFTTESLEEKPSQIFKVDLTEQKLIEHSTITDQPGKIILSNKDTCIFYTSNDENPTMQVFNSQMQNIKTLEETKVNHAVRVSSQRFISTSGISQSLLSIWDSEQLQQISKARHVKEHFLPITFLSTSPDGKLMVSCDYNGIVALWDTTTFEVIKTHDTGENITGISVENDGEISVGFGVPIPDSQLFSTEEIRFYNRANVPQIPTPNPSEISDEDEQSSMSHSS